MTTVLKFFILFGVFSAVFGYNIRDDAVWFKDHDRITDRFLVGRLNGRNTLCNATRYGEQVEGVCLSARECLNAGGIKTGGCSILGTCCVIEKACSNVTVSKLSYFVPPKVLQSDCTLTVKPINKNVCQIRLDFVKFSIAQPRQPLEYFGSNKSYQCLDDSFTVSPAGRYLGFMHLCGENAGQHIYIPVNNQNNVALRFQLRVNRTLDFLPNPDWRIRIRQLECARLQATDINNIHSSLTSMHLHHHQHRPSYNNDYQLIAPNGCLQYYEEPTGTYESFNFNMHAGRYIGLTSYAICFRQTPDVCGMRHTAEYFEMNFNLQDQDGIVCHPPGPADEQTSHDSLQIPGGILHNMRRDYFCGAILNNTFATAYVPGPLHVVVRTDGFRPHDRFETGFRIRYEVLNSGCTIHA